MLHRLFYLGKNSLINATIGGHGIVVAYYPKYESIDAWYNDSGVPVSQIDFFGNSDQGQLKRVETLKSGMFWRVWVNLSRTHTSTGLGGQAGTDAVIKEENE